MRYYAVERSHVYQGQNTGNVNEQLDQIISKSEGIKVRNQSFSPVAGCVTYVFRLRQTNCIWPKLLQLFHLAISKLIDQSRMLQATSLAVFFMVWQKSDLLVGRLYILK